MQFFHHFQIFPPFAHIVVFDDLVSENKVASSLMQVIDNSVVNNVGVDKYRLWILDSGLEHFVNEILRHPHSIIIYSEIYFIFLAVNIPELDDIHIHISVVVVGKFYNFNPVILSGELFHVCDVFGNFRIEPQMPPIKGFGLLR